GSPPAGCIRAVRGPHWPSAKRRRGTAESLAGASDLTQAARGERACTHTPLRARSPIARGDRSRLLLRLRLPRLLARAERDGRPAVLRLHAHPADGPALQLEDQALSGRPFDVEVRPRQPPQRVGQLAGYHQVQPPLALHHLDPRGAVLPLAP